jgi:hypothetical protein
MLGEGTVHFGVLTGRGSRRVARNRLELFAQFAGNEIFSSQLHFKYVCMESIRCSETVYLNGLLLFRQDSNSEQRWP